MQNDNTAKNTRSEEEKEENENGREDNNNSNVNNDNEMWVCKHMTKINVEIKKIN